MVVEEHDRLLDIEEELVQELELPYRVVNVAAGDLGASATKKYDIEAWFPSQERYREITSTSNTTDYQARRLEIRHRRDDKQLEPVHTLNGTAVTGRAMLAIMENFQEADGSVSDPGSRCTSSARRRSSGLSVAARLLLSQAPLARSSRAGATVSMPNGGVPERPNGSVLKTDDRRKAVRGFKSHPRRSTRRKPASERRVGHLGVLRNQWRCSAQDRLNPLSRGADWRLSLTAPSRKRWLCEG